MPRAKMPLIPLTATHKRILHASPNREAMQVLAYPVVNPVSVSVRMAPLTPPTVDQLIDFLLLVLYNRSERDELSNLLPAPPSLINYTNNLLLIYYTLIVTPLFLISNSLLLIN
jgi:hypothetical protein